MVGCLAPVLPRVVREMRDVHRAVVWYDTGKGVAPGGYRHHHHRRQGRFPPRRLGLAVSSWGRPCGVAEYSRGLVWGLRQLGHTVEVVSDLGDACRIARERTLPIVHFQHEYGLWDPGELRRETTALYRAGVAPVATVHALASAPDHNIVLKECFPTLLVHSESMKAETAASLGVPEGRIEVVPFGVRARALPERRLVREELGLGDAPAIGFVGFFYPQKGIGELGLAVEELRRDIPDLLCFLFAGVADNDISRDYFHEVDACFNERGLWDSVKVIPEFLPEERMVSLLHAMDVIVLPYREHPTRQMSAAVRTAMAAQRPIIVTDTFTFSDLGPEVCKIPDNSPGRIAAAVRELVRDADRQQALIEAVRTHIRRNSLVEVAARHISIYSRL